MDFILKLYFLVGTLFTFAVFCYVKDETIRRYAPTHLILAAIMILVGWPIFIVYAFMLGLKTEKRK